MEHDLEQKMKERLLESLIEHMSDKMSDHMKPKGMAVEVAAPDKEHLAEGLNKAKDVLGHDESDVDEGEITGDHGDDDMSDEERLEALLEGDEDEDEHGLK